MISVAYTPPPPGPGGPGTVYLVTDDDEVKVGYTESTADQRVAALQTGNPRTIRTLATVHGVGADIELALQNAFAAHHRTGE